MRPSAIASLSAPAFHAQPGTLLVLARAPIALGCLLPAAVPILGRLALLGDLDCGDAMLGRLDPLLGQGMLLGLRCRPTLLLGADLVGFGSCELDATAASSITSWSSASRCLCGLTVEFRA